MWQHCSRILLAFFLLDFWAFFLCLLPAFMLVFTPLLLLQVNLVGGYYDAGDNVKFGFPMAFTITMLSWSVIEYGSQMASQGQLGYSLEAIQWGTDYFIKAHPEPNVLYGEVPFLSLFLPQVSSSSSRVQWREVTASLHLFAKFANSFVPEKNPSSCSAIVFLLWRIATFKSLLKEMSSVALDCVEVSLWLLSLERKGRKERGSLKTDCLSSGSVMLSGRRRRFGPRVLAKTRRHDYKSAGIRIDTEGSRLRPCRRNCSSHGCCIHCFQITRKSYLRKRASQSRRAGNNPYQWCCCCTSKPYFFFHFPLSFAHLVSSLVSLASFLLPPATHLPFAHLDLLWFPYFLLPPASHASFPHLLLYFPCFLSASSSKSYLLQTEALWKALKKIWSMESCGSRSSCPTASLFVRW